MGGRSIFVLSLGDPNARVVFETLTEYGERFAIAQRYIPDIVQTGDSRVLLVDGQPIPYALARIPTGGDHRGNLAAGARGLARPLNERDRWLAGQIGPTLAARGMRRPLSIMRAHTGAGWIELLYKVVGAGLHALGARKAGDELSVLGPIGRPFVPHTERPRALLLGGGVGIPPMVFLAERLSARNREAGGAGNATRWKPLVLMPALSGIA